MLTFVFVGGGYAGIEALAELEDMSIYATRYYPELSRATSGSSSSRPPTGSCPRSVRTWAAHRRAAAQAQDRRPAEHPAGVVRGRARRALRRRGVRHRDDRLDGRGQGAPDADAHRAAADEKGRLRLPGDLQVDGVDGAWSPATARRCPTSPGPGRDTAQRPARGPPGQGARRQIVLRAERRAPKPTSTSTSGRCPLGLYKGVAQVYGIKLEGFPAWFMHRTYHVSRVPTLNRKVRVVPTGRWPCSSARDVSPSGSCRTRAGSSCSPRTPGAPGSLPPPREDDRAQASPSESSATAG